MATFGAVFPATGSTRVALVVTGRSFLAVDTHTRVYRTAPPKLTRQPLRAGPSYTVRAQGRARGWRTLPPTPCIRLACLAGSTGIEPATSGLTGHSCAASLLTPDVSRLSIRALDSLGCGARGTCRQVCTDKKRTLPCAARESAHRFTNPVGGRKCTESQPRGCPCPCRVRPPLGRRRHPPGWPRTGRRATWAPGRGRRKRDECVAITSQAGPGPIEASGSHGASLAPAQATFPSVCLPRPRSAGGPGRERTAKIRAKAAKEPAR
jgi:hypothetical protein